jgi:chemotaxis protein MotB
MRASHRPVAPRLVGVLAASVFAGGCLVTKGTYEQCTGELGQTKSALSTTAGERDKAKAERDATGNKLTEALSQNQTLVTKISSMGQSVEQLLGEKDKLSQERADLSKQVEELNRLRSQSEARAGEYKQLLARLHKMIDAGTLQVKIRNGRMLVRLSSDLLFPPGGVRLKPEARQSIEALAETLKGFPDRKFQVVGHSDATPISTARFPSNWELSAERAIEVVKVMVDAGVPPEMLSAAGSAEFEPLMPNDTLENKLANRRVELVFLPKIDELPGFAEALGGDAAPSPDARTP